MAFGPKLIPTGRGNRRAGMSARIALGGGSRSSSFRLVLAFSKAMGPKYPCGRSTCSSASAKTPAWCFSPSHHRIIPVGEEWKVWRAPPHSARFRPEVPNTRALPTRDCTFEWRGENQIAVNLPVSGWKADLKSSARGCSHDKRDEAARSGSAQRRNPPRGVGPFSGGQAVHGRRARLPHDWRLPKAKWASWQPDAGL
jgi:hypothetical protein